LKMITEWSFWLMIRLFHWTLKLKFVFFFLHLSLFSPVSH